MKALAGTGRLFRLSLRLDRVRLPIWIVANVGLVALTLPQLAQAYNTEPKRILYATTSASSAVTRLLNGALAGPDLGSIAVVETFLLAVLLFALMNIFLVTRHTRQEEETNRSEVIGSALVGRQAGLTATLILAAIVNIITASLIFVVFRLNDLPMEGSLAYSAALGMMGMVFAGVAAVTAQLFESTRTANSLAGLVFGLAFIIRGIGDVLGTLKPGGLGVTPNFLSWLSPVGWVLNINPFIAERWWVLGLFGVLTVALVVVAYVLLGARDVGAALFAPRPGKSHAAPWLLKRYGLIWRLNRVSTISWMAAIVLSGATIGAVAHEFTKLIEQNEEMQKVFAELGGTRSVTDIIFSFMFIILAIATTGYALQIITRMRNEESSGRLELMFSTSYSRHRLLVTYISYALVTSTVILFLTGLTAGLVFGLVGGGPILENAQRLSWAILAYVPALCAMVGATVAVFGRLPRGFVSFAWGSLAASLLIFQLGAILKLPQWVINLSPMAHTPLVPNNNVDWVPLAIQSGIAVVLILVGFVLFRRRDIATS